MKIKNIIKKFIDSIEINNWEIETELGFKPITHIHKTIKYDIWEIKTKSFSLKGADKHIVMLKGMKQCFIKDLKIGDKVITKNGLESVIYIKKYNKKVNMYDVTVDSNTHTLYTNNILSHNTTIAKIYLMHYILFNEDKNVAILANKEKTALKILREIKDSYKKLPLWLQQGIIGSGWNKSSIALENGSRILAASTASSAVRGESINLLFLDEFAFVPQNIASEFMRSVYPTITSGQTAKIIIVSTPNGLNHFYHIYRAATRNDNQYRPIKINWDEVPGRDENFKKQIISDNNLIFWNQEYGCKFLGSTSTLIDSEVLERMEIKIPIESKLGDLLQIYEKPEPKKMYILGIDSAKGVGGDYSVIQVLKINDEFDIDEVALYRNNQIEAYNFAQVCIEVSKYYNDAYMMVENNDVGSSVADTIWYTFEYDKILNCDKDGIGIRSTKKSKLAANLLLKRYLENGWLGLVDKETVYELSRYTEISPNVFRAENRENDDCVTSLLWGLYFISTVFFDGKNTDVKKIDDKFKIIDDEAPIMVIDVGDNNPVSNYDDDY